MNVLVKTSPTNVVGIILTTKHVPFSIEHKSTREEGIRGKTRRDVTARRDSLVRVHLDYGSAKALLIRGEMPAISCKYFECCCVCHMCLQSGFTNPYSYIKR